MSLRFDAPPVTALGWLIGGEWRAHPARVITAVLAIAVGVALGFAVHLVNASALDRFSRGLAVVNGAADLRVEARSDAGFDEGLYPRLARLPEIAAASPVVTVGGAIGSTPVTLLGLDMLRAGVVTPGLLVHPVAGESALSVFDPDAIFLSPGALSVLHVAAGTRIRVVAGASSASFRVAGTIPATEAGRVLGVIDIAAAQTRFGRLGRLDRIDIAYRPGADRAAARAAVAHLLPADASIAAASDDARRTDALSRAYRVNLDMLALVALLTGGFLVYSAQALSIARRRPQFALLRVLGGTAGAVIGQVLVEGLVLGLIGAGLGILGGFGLATVVLRLVGGDLGSGYFATGSAPPLVIDGDAALSFAVIGLGAALGGSLLPALAAARVQPAVALKNLGDAMDPRRQVSIRPALALALGGAAASLFPAINGLPVFGYVSMALLLAAGIAAMPRLARLVLAPIARRRFRSPAFDLAAARLWGAPSQAAVALSGTVASTALTVAMAIMVTSFRASVDEWLGQVLPADIYMTVQNGVRIDSAMQARLSRLPGVATIAFGLQQPLSLSADRPPVTLVVRDDPRTAFPAIGPQLTVGRGETPVWVSEPAARLWALPTGARVTLPIGRAGVPVTVAGIWRDYARQDGAIALASADYDRLTGDRARGEAAVSLTRGADEQSVAARLEAALPPNLRGQATLVPVVALRARALAIFDRSFAVTYGLEAVALLVGLAGVATTISAQTFARIREFGMLRHLGVTRRQIAAMLASEGALLGLVGAVAGVALGAVLAQVLIQVINPQSFNWTMATRLPAGLLAGVVGTLVAAATLTAAVAGRHAVAIDAVRAVREDW